MMLKSLCHQSTCEFYNAQSKVPSRRSTLSKFLLTPCNPHAPLPSLRHPSFFKISDHRCRQSFSRARVIPRARITQDANCVRTQPQSSNERR
ncbi:hypothetical protein FA95DRAFT_610233 [Auriscalpium vulgare]|uniref:Uncharacterized protein n=1 Tax=Auriscalpium vulgare TaxID=40419 RepID=A0ACB8RDU6_9AGAM|nr:hypothetical protein FA95DRAFT_610233 [Auriscalpium vulgare]